MPPPQCHLIAESEDAVAQPVHNRLPLPRHALWAPSTAWAAGTLALGCTLMHSKHAGQEQETITLVVGGFIQLGHGVPYILSRFCSPCQTETRQVHCKRHEQPACQIAMHFINTTGSRVHFLYVTC